MTSPNTPLLSSRQTNVTLMAISQLIGTIIGFVIKTTIAAYIFSYVFKTMVVIK